MLTIAPAKINLSLEVLGRRPDGYHEIRSVMQTIYLRDELQFEAAEALTLEVSGPHAASEEDLVLKAARALAHAAGRRAGARITLRKRIPVGAGLGGGSSDAAATLRCLNELWVLRLGRKEIAGIAAEVGSDVPFFVYGGTALVEGMGEVVTPLPDTPDTWPLLIVPPMTLPEKTRRMYWALNEGDFSDGSQTAAMVKAVGSGQHMTDGDFRNAFNRAAYDMFTGLGGYRDSLLNAGAAAVHV